MILDFIVKYWDLIASLILVIASIIIMAIRKKPVINEMDTILLKVLEKLPDWIQQAESLKGAEVKKSLVIESCKKYVLNQFSLNLSDEYVALIGSYIEAYLSTPQKH